MLKSAFAGATAALVASMPGPIGRRLRNEVLGAELGCCKCQGTNRGCIDAQSQSACNTHCGGTGKEGVFSEKHSCQDGKGGTKVCKLKTGKDLDEACPEEEECSTAAVTTAAPPIVFAEEMAESRVAMGFASDISQACVSGEACASSGLFGLVPDLKTVFDPSTILGANRYKATGRSLTPDTPGESTDDVVIDFTTPKAVDGFYRLYIDMLPDSAKEVTDEVGLKGVDRVYMVGADGEGENGSPSQAILVGTAGNRVFLSASSIPSGVLSNLGDRDFEGLLSRFANPPTNLDSQLLLNDVIWLDGPSVAPDPNLRVTVFDGQSLPLTGESEEQTAFRQLTDTGTINAVRVTWPVTVGVDQFSGQVTVVYEAREFASPEEAQSFAANSQQRVIDYFGDGLSTFAVTEFDRLGEFGTGYIYMLNPSTGGFVGGVTGYTQFGTLVGVANVNIRADGPPTPEQSALVQDGRFFANPGVAILEQQVSVWSGTSGYRILNVDDQFTFTGGLGAPVGESCRPGLGDCMAGLVCCDGICVDPQSNRLHCGKCGSVCVATENCCFGICTDVTKVVRHCGACANVCPEPQACCAGRCADLSTDIGNCGGCGLACAESEICLERTCKAPTSEQLPVEPEEEGDESGKEVAAIPNKVSLYSPPNLAMVSYQTAGKGRTIESADRFTEFQVLEGAWNAAPSTLGMEAIFGLVRGAAEANYHDGFRAAVRTRTDEQRGLPAQTTTDWFIKTSRKGAAEINALIPTVSGIDGLTFDVLPGFEGESAAWTDESSAGRQSVNFVAGFNSGLLIRTVEGDKIANADLSDPANPHVAAMSEYVTAFVAPIRDDALGRRHVIVAARDRLVQQFYAQYLGRNVKIDSNPLEQRMYGLDIREPMQELVVSHTDIPFEGAPPDQLQACTMTLLGRITDPGTFDPIVSLEGSIFAGFAGVQMFPVDASPLGNSSFARYFDLALENGSFRSGVIYVSVTGDTFTSSAVFFEATPEGILRFDQSQAANFIPELTGVAADIATTQANVLASSEEPSLNDLQVPSDEVREQLKGFVLE